ncbi:MAG TPA: hypothetical protein DCW83_13740, partial [Saprospirales bacterium]|nr:hypothetical protein [Saprospirales bacterium]
KGLQIEKRMEYIYISYKWFGIAQVKYKTPKTIFILLNTPLLFEILMKNILKKSEVIQVKQLIHFSLRVSINNTYKFINILKTQNIH